MSAPTADTRAGPSGGLLIGVAAGLMLLAALAAYLLLGTGGPIDGRAKMTAVFGVADLPSGLRVASATRMPSGGELVVYEVPGTPPETPAPAPEPVAAGANPPRVDWSKVPIPDVSGPPRQASFLFVPGERGRSVLGDMIREVQGRDLGELGREGGTVLLERGRMGFRGWDSDWIHLRTYEPGGTFRDALRISLSTPEYPCVLTATWPRGTPASLAALTQLISPLADPPR